MLSGSAEIYLKTRDYVEKEVVDDIVEKIKQLLDEREREAKIEVLTEIFQTCYQEDSRTLELVQEKLQDLKDLSLVLS